MIGINERIKEMRNRKGLTLLEVSKYIGVKEATIQRYESGTIKNIKHETICKLADLFDCEPSYLMGWSANERTKNTTNNATTLIIKNDNANSHKISDQEVELLRIFESLNIKGQTELLSYAFKLEEKLNENKKITRG